MKITARQRPALRLVGVTALTVVMLVALVGIALANPGNGNGNGNAWGHNQGNSPSAAHSQYGPPGNQYGPPGNQYGPPGDQYGLHRVTICHGKKHKHTIRVAAPAVRAHLHHGDSLGAC